MALGPKAPAATRVALVAACLLAGCRAYDRDEYYRAIDAQPDALAMDRAEPDVALDALPTDTMDVVVAMDAADVAPDVPGMDVVAMDTADVTPIDVPRPDVAPDVPRPDVVDFPDVAPDVPRTDAADVAPDTRPDPTGCDDRHAGALFCDGFEDASLSAWTDTAIMSGAVTRTTSTVYRGAGALRTEITAAGGAASIYAQTFAPLTSGELYLRAYYYLPSSFTLSGLAYLSAVETTTPYDNLSMQVESDGLLSAYDSPGMRYLSGSPGAILPRDRWVCLEFHITISATAGAMELFMDGSPAGSASGFSTLPGGGIGAFEVGITYAPPEQGPLVLYVDEAVASRTRIGCD